MKLIHPQTEDKLGFTYIRDFLTSQCSTEEGKHFCQRMEALRNPKYLHDELLRVKECKDLLELDESFSLDYTSPVGPLLVHAEVPGNYLASSDLFNLLKWLRMVRELIVYFRARKEKYPRIWKQWEGKELDKSLLKQIEGILDDRGNIKDSASPALKSLRENRHRISSELRKVLQRSLRHAHSQGWSTAAEITIRNDRLVIPMLANFKGRIKGFVHDVSSSGNTIFLEPSEALEYNNRIRELHAEENNEIIRILQEVTDQIREHLDTLVSFIRLVGRLDFLRAKGRLAVRLQANLPVLAARSGKLRLVKAYHPLLLLREGRIREEVVPLSLELNPEQRVILISGPNAGGKSVTLKTVGLLQMMLQSGLLVSTEEESEFCMFDALYIDIGDEQSIQSDLSTYTSHLQNMRSMLEHLSKGALFLLDEFGSGTDPKMGGAMAEAFLERFVDSQARGIITTHYGNLKVFADRSPGIENAAMQFDPENLAPTYHIEVGVPGRSYAFEIARKVGIPEEILSIAREKMGTTEMHSEELLLKLEAQRAELEQVLNENQSKNKELKNLLNRNQQLKKNIESKQNKMLRDAHEQAQGLINAANKKIERTIREIKEAQAEKEYTRQLRKELGEMLPEPPEEILEPEEESIPEPDELPGEKPEVGDWAKLKDSGNIVRVLELQGKRVIVAAGDLRVTAKLKDLVKVKVHKPKKNPQNASNKGKLVIKKRMGFNSELDVKGLRVEQALPIVEKFMDDAVIAGLGELRILHGKGTGALRESIRDLLQGYPAVVSLKDAHADRGGAGWTVVKMRHA